MDILYLLIPLAVVLMIVAVGGLLWAIRSGQFDDMEGPAHRILLDDDDPRIPGRRDAETRQSEDSPDSGADARAGSGSSSAHASASAGGANGDEDP